MDILRWQTFYRPCLFLSLLSSSCDTSVRSKRKRIDWWDIGTRHNLSGTFWLIDLSVVGNKGLGTKLEVLETPQRLVVYEKVVLNLCVDNK
jgi:hypothetical protein